MAIMSHGGSSSSVFSTITVSLMCARLPVTASLADMLVVRFGGRFMVAMVETDSAFDWGSAGVPWLYATSYPGLRILATTATLSRLHFGESAISGLLLSAESKRACTSRSSLS